MSYSLTARAPTKALVLQMLADKFDAEVLKHQLVHARDRAQALATAQVFVDLLADDDTKDVNVTLSGGLSFNPDGESLQGASVSVGASLAVRTVD